MVTIVNRSRTWEMLLPGILPHRIRRDVSSNSRIDERRRKDDDRMRMHVSKLLSAVVGQSQGEHLKLGSNTRAFSSLLHAVSL